MILDNIPLQYTVSPPYDIVQITLDKGAGPLTILINTCPVCIVHSEKRHVPFRFPTSKIKDGVQVTVQGKGVISLILRYPSGMIKKQRLLGDDTRPSNVTPSVSSCTTITEEKQRPLCLPRPQNKIEVPSLLSQLKSISIEQKSELEKLRSLPSTDNMVRADEIDKSFAFLHVTYPDYNPEEEQSSDDDNAQSESVSDTETKNKRYKTDVSLNENLKKKDSKIIENESQIEMKKEFPTENDTKERQKSMKRLEKENNDGEDDPVTKKVRNIKKTDESVEVFNMQKDRKKNKKLENADENMKESNDAKENISKKVAKEENDDLLDSDTKKDKKRKRASDGEAQENKKSKFSTKEEEILDVPFFPTTIVTKTVREGDKKIKHFTNVLWSYKLKVNGTEVDNGEIISQLGGNETLFDQGCIDIKLGEKRKIKIPAHQGYGEKGLGNLIPPHANLEYSITAKECR